MKREREREINNNDVLIKIYLKIFFYCFFLDIYINTANKNNK